MDSFENNVGNSFITHLLLTIFVIQNVSVNWLKVDIFGSIASAYVDTSRDLCHG